MVGIIVQLAISWLILRVFEKGQLSVLGFFPTRQRLRHVLLFFTVTAVFCGSGFLLKMYFGHQQWLVNPQLTISKSLQSVWWVAKSVLFEELIFRGVLLYLLLKRIGRAGGILISGAAFGIYHWFSFGILGNLPQMAIVFVITGTMGLLLAYAFSKTGSILTPVAIHFGWNLTQIFLFSQGPIGDGLWIPVAPGEFRTDSYLVFILVSFLPVVGALCANYMLLRRLP